MAETAEAAGAEARGTAAAKGRAEPILLREFPNVGKYRVRVVKSSGGPRANVVLDVREYAKSESFEGFTRRGIRIATLDEARRLREAIEAVEREGLLR